MKIKAKHYGLSQRHIVALYKEQGEWRIYMQSSYKEKDRKALIQEIMSEKGIKKSDIKIGKIDSLSVSLC